MKTFVIAGIITAMLSLVQSSGAAQDKETVTTIEAQVVCCEDCWQKADRTKVTYGTAEDLDAAVRCVGNGDPSLLAVLDTKGKTTFHILESGRFSPGKNWLSYIGDRVRVVGQLRTAKKKSYFRVDSLVVIAPAIGKSDTGTVITDSAELVLDDLFGAKQKLSAYRGRIVVLNFWATWCGPCVKEMPDLSQIQNDYGALGVQVIGAAADTVENREEVLKFAKRTKVNFPLWLGATTSQMARFGLGRELPGTVIIGRDGKILHRIKGAVTRDSLKKLLDPMLNAIEKDAKRKLAANSRESFGKKSSVPS